MASDRTLCLAFDTATPTAVLAVGEISDDNHQLLASESMTCATNQVSTLLVASLEQLLHSVGLHMREMQAIACGCGPGTFTGVRVAVATAKGLAFALARPTVPITTLAILAASAQTEGDVLAMIDARRGEVYANLFTCNAGPRPRIITSQPDRCVAADSAVPDTAGLTTISTVDAAVTPAGLWRAAVSAWQLGRRATAAELSPIYLRASDAELQLHRPKRPFKPSPFA